MGHDTPFHLHTDIRKVSCAGTTLPSGSLVHPGLPPATLPVLGSEAPRVPGAGELACPGVCVWGGGGGSRGWWFGMEWGERPLSPQGCDVSNEVAQLTGLTGLTGPGPGEGSLWQKADGRRVKCLPPCSDPLCAPASRLMKSPNDCHSPLSSCAGPLGQEHFYPLMQ